MGTQSLRRGLPDALLKGLRPRSSIPPRTLVSHPKSLTILSSICIKHLPHVSESSLPPLQYHPLTRVSCFITLPLVSARQPLGTITCRSSLPLTTKTARLFVSPLCTVLSQPILFNFPSHFRYDGRVIPRHFNISRSRNRRHLLL